MMRKRIAAVLVAVLFFTAMHPQTANAASITTGYSHHYDYVYIPPVGWLGLEYDMRLKVYYDRISWSQVQIYPYSTMHACAIYAQRTYRKTGFMQNIWVYWYIYDAARGGDIDSDGMNAGSGYQIWERVCPNVDDWQMNRTLRNYHWPPAGTYVRTLHSTGATDGSYGGAGPWRYTYTGQLY